MPSSTLPWKLVSYKYSDTLNFRQNFFYLDEVVVKLEVNRVNRGSVSDKLPHTCICMGEGIGT